MKKLFVPARILSLILFATAVAFEGLAQQPVFVKSPITPPVVGGWTVVSVTNPAVVAAAEFAITAAKSVREHSLFPPARLALIRIVSAQEQVVAGMNVRLSLEVNVNGTTREAVAVVFRALSNKCTLTSWNWSSPVEPPPSGIMGRVDEQGSIWTVDVLSDRGERMAVLQTDRSGSFEVDLEPGNYVLTPIYYPPLPPPGRPMPDFVICGPATPVKVVKYRMTFVVLPISITLPLM